MANEENPYVVMTGIALPARERKQRKLKYPFENMGVNDMFAFESKERNAVLASSRVFRKRHKDRRFEVREIPGNPGIMGIWRTK